MVVAPDEAEFRELSDRLDRWYLLPAAPERPAVLHRARPLTLSVLWGAQGTMFLLGSGARVGPVEWIALLLNRLRLADEERFGSAAPMQMARLCQYDSGGRDRLRQLRSWSGPRLDDLMASLARHRRAQLFATGPSLDDVTSADVLDDAARITCNSAVRDAELVATIRPHVLVFGDPAFHFGASEYAEEFRQCVEDFARAHPECAIAVPFEFLGLADARFGHITERLVGFPVRRRGDADHARRTRRGWAFPRTGNILTTFMLPAVQRVETIEVFGCDGRAPSDERYWSHSTRGQFASLYQSVVDTHPGFFNAVDYERYYEVHCGRVEKQVRWVEERGGRLASITASHIPAFRARTGRRHPAPPGSP